MQAPVSPQFGVEQPSAWRGFAQGYSALPGLPDAMVEPDGSLRPYWRLFVAMLDDLGPEELKKRWDHARRLIHDNGVTHNVYGDPNGLDRPWNLDLVPLLIQAHEWDNVCEALAQRARLLDRLLADLYGPGETIYGGILPPQLLWANPAFLRACHGIRPPGDRWIHLYAADLVRGVDGQYQVLNDRTQAPSGAGYSLENRIVLSRAVPSIYRQANVHRLAPFFVTLRESLAALATSSRGNPRVVLLTPGPYNETYFEHSYLARYLGYQLVQGNDLTVRDNRVFLKTLGGLQRVDVILRRVDDDFCDPLELYADSYLGVAGLLQAVRSGNVAVANALGTGVLDAPGFMPFLPSLCKHLLGEELKLPSVPSWWCGDRSSRQYILEHLDEMVIKPAFPARGLQPIFGCDLSEAQRAELAVKISARPEQYIAQSRVMECTTPALVDQKVEPRRFVIRAYLAASENSYIAMHGGLTRVAGSGDSFSVSLQQGAGSKDTWILSEGSVSQVSLLPTSGHPIPLSRGGGDLPSRVADDLFWLGRYVERAESVVRLARGTLSRLIDPNTLESSHAVRTLSSGILPPWQIENPELDRELVKTLFDMDSGVSLRATGVSVQRLAGILRDQISIDAWRVLQAICRSIAAFELDPQEPSQGVPELFDDLVSHCAAFAGLATDSITRGQAWLFVDIGRRIERAIATARLLRSTVVDGADDAALLESILDITDSSVTYRRRYLTHVETHAIVDLLLADESNPRAVAFQLVEIERDLAALPRDLSHPHRNTDQNILLRLRALIQLPDMVVLCAATNGKRSELSFLLTQVIDQAANLSQAITQLYFSHSAVPHELTEMPEAPDA